MDDGGAVHRAWQAVRSSSRTMSTVIVDKAKDRRPAGTPPVSQTPPVFSAARPAPPPEREQDLDLGDLLLGFFDFYGRRFDFSRSGIAPLIHCVHDRDQGNLGRSVRARCSIVVLRCACQTIAIGFLLMLQDFLSAEQAHPCVGDQ